MKPRRYSEQEAMDEKELLSSAVKLQLEKEPPT
jgi:hypothetical protein